MRPWLLLWLLLLLLLLLLLVVHATQFSLRVACCGGHKGRAAATGGGGTAEAEKVGKAEQSRALRGELQGKEGRGEGNVTPTIDKRRARGDCKMRKTNLGKQSGWVW